MGKFNDMLVHYNRVKYCSCLEHGPSDDLQDIIQMIVKLQKVLPDEFRITDEDTHHFATIFREYRNDLLAKYMKRYYFFSPTYSARMWRKYFHVDKLKPFYGGVTRETLFFTQTLHDFLERYLSDRINPRIIFYVDAKKLTARGIVLHKMYLATLLVREIIGYTTIDSEINHIESLLRNNINEIYEGE